MALDIPPTSCRVLTLMPAAEKIQLISTNRHITQGWVDLVSINAGTSANSFNGKSRVIKNDPYELHFVFPRGRNFAIKTATAQTAAGAVPVRMFNHQGWGTVRIDSPRTTEVDWTVVFESADSYKYPTKAPTGLRVEPVGLDGGTLSWGAQYYLNAGYQVYLDGNLLGYTGNTTFPLRGLDPSRAYTTEVRAVWDDGTIGPTHAKTELKFTLETLLPNEIPLSSLTAVPAAGRGAGRGGTGRGAGAVALTIGSRRFEGGIGARGGSEVEYDIAGIFTSFSARFGVDDGFEGSLSLAVIGDGKELWNSGPLKKSGDPGQVNVSIAGVRRLILRATAVGEMPQAQGQAQGRDRGAGFAPQAAWFDAKVSGRTGVK